MNLYDMIQTWDVETLAEFLTALEEGVEDNLLESVQKHLPDGYDVSLVQVDHDLRVASNIQLLLQERYGTTV